MNEPESQAIAFCPFPPAPLLGHPGFPFADSTHKAPLLWQAQSGMRFKMPEGYVVIPPGQGNVDPLPSNTYTAALGIEGGADPAGFGNGLQD